MNLLERANRAQRICNDVLTHKTSPKPLPVPASDDDDDVFVWNAWKDSIAEIERQSSENSALKHNIEYYREMLDAIQVVLGRKNAEDFVRASTRQKLGG